MDKTNSTRRRSDFIDITGQKFGRWTVLEFHSIAKSGHSLWLCRCECGVEKPVGASPLKSGRSRSCRSCVIRRHDMEGTPEYFAWSNMLSRCRNTNNPGYDHYGGRGIAVCERWQKSFVAFLENMGTQPSPQHSLERIDNSLGYSKDNCKWATGKEQARNTRRNRTITHDGRTLCLAAWAEEIGINPCTLQCRLARGWSVERALTTPVQVQNHWSKLSKRHVL